MSYISLSDKDKKDMLAKIGLTSFEDLFDSIPEDLKLKKPLNIPPALSEPELEEYFKELAGQNKHPEFLSFLGAGAYNHYIPAIVDYLSSRGEFISPYTPYQAEVSQGTLHVIFEFQSLICQLTGMEIANASLYDGASGAAEAVLMADRLKQKSKVLVARTLHPEYRRVIDTYTRNINIAVEEIGFDQRGEVDIQDLESKLDGETSAVLIQSPNFFGNIENIRTVSDLAHQAQALSIVVVTEFISLGLLESPGSLGADIVTGEGQSLGLPLSFGGPYLGVMACRSEFLRQFPGRIAGETTDVDGKTGYVLTLSTREQHIRRERATSNICTNQAWCAVRATIFLEALGKVGFREMAEQNFHKAHYAAEKLGRIMGVKQKFSGPFFNEFVIELPRDWPSVHRALEEEGIIPGLGLEESFPELRHCALLCTTEKHNKEDIDRLASTLADVLEQ